MSGSLDLLLGGIDASNPLAFLAALGTLRSASQALPEGSFALGWTQSGGAWRPRLACSLPLARADVVEKLHGWLSVRSERPEFDLGAGQNKINVAPEIFRRFVQEAAANASREDRSTVDFAAAYGCEALTDQQGRVSNTALRTMSGQQRLLQFMKVIIGECTPNHLERALFEPWAYEDPIEKRTLRLDPLDDKRYALQWRDPSGDPERGRRGSVLGANRLAIEGLPFMTTVPAARGLETLGFRRLPRGEPVWRWPVWQPLVPADVVRSLLSRPELQQADRPAAGLREIGVVAVFQSARVRLNDYYRNFAPAVQV